MYFAPHVSTQHFICYFIVQSLSLGRDFVKITRKADYINGSLVPMNLLSP